MLIVTRQITEGELAERFGVMRRQYQPEVIDAGRRLAVSAVGLAAPGDVRGDRE